MRLKGIPLLIAVIVLAGCGERFDLASTQLRIVSVTFSTTVDNQGFLVEPRERFRPSDQRIYTMVSLDGVRETVEVIGRWTHVDSHQEIALTTIEAVPLREFARFDLTSPRPWPEGIYLFEVEAVQREERVTGSALYRVGE